MILYEYPFNERIRTYLRLEHLFRRLGELVPRSHPIDHHYALATIFEVMDVAARADLKSDVMKDLDKQKLTLNGYRGNPAIAETVLDEKRSVDDQVEWLDDATLLYGLPRADAPGDSDVWAVSVDAPAAPRVFIEHAWSPSVVR